MDFKIAKYLHGAMSEEEKEVFEREVETKDQLKKRLLEFEMQEPLDFDEFQQKMKVKTSPNLSFLKEPAVAYKMAATLLLLFLGCGVFLSTIHKVDLSNDLLSKGKETHWQIFENERDEFVLTTSLEGQLGDEVWLLGVTQDLSIDVLFRGPVKTPFLSVSLAKTHLKSYENFVKVYAENSSNSPDLNVLKACFIDRKSCSLHYELWDKNE